MVDLARRNQPKIRLYLPFLVDITRIRSRFFCVDQFVKMACRFCSNISSIKELINPGSLIHRLRAKSTTVKTWNYQIIRPNELLTLLDQADYSVSLNVGFIWTKPTCSTGLPSPGIILDISWIFDLISLIFYLWKFPGYLLGFHVFCYTLIFFYNFLWLNK